MDRLAKGGDVIQSHLSKKEAAHYCIDEIVNTCRPFGSKAVEDRTAQADQRSAKRQSL